MMLNDPCDAGIYISTNEKFLLAQLDEFEIKTLYQSDTMKINVIKEGKNLVQVNNHYGNKDLTEIFKEMIDCASV